MSRHNGIYRRKARKLSGYIILSCGVFCIVIALFIGGFFLLHKEKSVISPLASFATLMSSRNPQAKALYAVAQECTLINLSCQQIHTESGDGIAFNVQNHTIIISASKDIHQQMASLQVTIHQLTMEGKDYRGLDFRYDRPVISY